MVSGCLATSAGAEGTAAINVTVVSGSVSGPPVANAVVSAVGTWIAGITNSSGLAVLTVPAPGTYQVHAMAAGYCSGARATVAVAATSGATTSVTLVLCPLAIELTGLVVTPVAISMPFGTAQQFTVTGVLSDGNSTVPTVAWTATGGSITANGLYTAGTTSGAFLVTATAVATPISDDAEVTVVSLPSTTGSDEITTLNEASATAILSFDAGDGTSCLEDRVASGIHVVLLGVNAHPPGTTSTSGTACHNAVAILSPNHGFFYSSNPDDFPWTTSADNLPATLPPRVRVPVSVWVAHKGSGTLAELFTLINYTHLARATDLFTESGAGLELVADASAGGSPAVTNVTTLPAAAILRAAATSGCESAAQIRANAAIYHPDHLNIYYVGAIAGAPANPTGYNCYVEGAQDIMFVRSDIGLPHTLAHEMGHALGLLEPTWGHTHDLANFALQDDGTTPRNFMAYDTAEMPKPFYISIGQVFRVNLATRSWLNLPMTSGKTPREAAAGGATPVFSIECPCQADESIPDCPQLSLTHLAGGPLSPGPSYALSCRSIPAAPSVTVCKDASLTLKARYFADKDGLVPARSADHFWRSADPAIATATELTSGYDIPDGGGWSDGTITGRAIGTTTVSVWVGGPSSQGVVTVTVTSCP